MPGAAQAGSAPESGRRGQEALAAGAVAAEITPVTISSRRGDVVVDADEHPRAGLTLEKLAGMRPVFKKDGTRPASTTARPC